MRPLTALALAAGLLAVAPTARAADPAEAALRVGDAYASPVALGAEGAAQAADELAEAARELGENGQDVKIAIVNGPVGAPSMRVFTQRLRDSLGYRGTLIVTAPGRPVFADGPLPPAVITVRFRSGMVGAIEDPLERVIAAAGLAAARGKAMPEPGSGVRELGALIGLALLGAGWAVAWGLRREQRGAREALVEARERTRVLMDALGARVGALEAGTPLPGGAQAPLRRARSLHDGAAAALAAAGSPGEARLAGAGVADGFAALAEAEAAAGRAPPADPFAGLCAFDPAHGPATGAAAPAGAAQPVPACTACARAAAEGDPPARRLVPAGRRVLPFDEAGLAVPPDGAP